METSFEAYLISKKIDSEAFRNAEPQVWAAWKKEFEQVHPNSFTVQKLNLINPIRRKYLLKVQTETPPPEVISPSSAKPGRPVMKPRPKIG
jgi:hypothetical protein